MAAMVRCNDVAFANPGSIHAEGWTAKSWVEEARSQVASLIKADPQKIIFTSGGSEANSLALLGIAPHLRAINRTHLLFSAIEHKSVLRGAEFLSEHGFEVEYIQPTTSGEVPVEAIQRRLRPNTGLVSVMCINNETGVKNDIYSIAEICEEHGVLFHTDCVQAYGKIPLDVESHPIDFLTASAHKLHGPKGVGCLYARDRTALRPLILGGDQEFGLRAGTENVPGIAGFGVAAKLAQEKLDRQMESYPEGGVRRMMYDLVLGLGDVCHINGSPLLYGSIFNMRFDGVSGESLVLMLSSEGVMVSAGSACTANSNKPSHVLKAMGLSDEEARSSIRVSVADDLRPEDEIEAIEKITKCVKKLREIGAGA